MLPVKSNLAPIVSKFFDDDWNSLFDWTNRNFSGTTITLPPVNIKEERETYLVEVAAPGLNKDDFQIELHNNRLTIKCNIQHEEEEQDKEVNYTRKEFSYQSFQRSFGVNERVVDSTRIEASYKNGLLLITLPKKDEAKEKPTRLITIS